MKPGGKYVAKDLYEVGGVPVLLKALLDGGYLNSECLTVTGKTIGENLEQILNWEFPYSFFNNIIWKIYTVYHS